MLLKRCDYSTCCPGKIAHTPQVKECWLAPSIQAHKGKENNTLQNAQKAKSTQRAKPTFRPLASLVLKACNA